MNQQLLEQWVVEEGNEGVTNMWSKEVSEVGQILIDLDSFSVGSWYSQMSWS